MGTKRVFLLSIHFLFFASSLQAERRNCPQGGCGNSGGNKTITFQQFQPMPSCSGRNCGQPTFQSFSQPSFQSFSQPSFQSFSQPSLPCQGPNCGSANGIVISNCAGGNCGTPSAPSVPSCVGGNCGVGHGDGSVPSGRPVASRKDINGPGQDKTVSIGGVAVPPSARSWDWVDGGPKFWDEHGNLIGADSNPVEIGPTPHEVVDTNPKVAPKEDEPKAIPKKAEPAAPVMDEQQFATDSKGRTVLNPLDNNQIHKQMEKDRKNGFNPIVVLSSSDCYYCRLLADHLIKNADSLKQKKMKVYEVKLSGNYTVDVFQDKDGNPLVAHSVPKVLYYKDGYRFGDRGDALADMNLPAMIEKH